MIKSIIKKRKPLHSNKQNSFKRSIISISTIIIITIVPAIVIITYLSSLKLVKSKVSEINTEMLEQLNGYIDNKLMEQERLAIKITENSLLQDYLLNASKYTLFERQNFINEIYKAFIDVVTLGNVENIYVFDVNKDLVATNDAYSKHIDFEESYSHLFMYADNKENKFIWVEPIEGIPKYTISSDKLGYLSLIKMIKSKIDNKKLGYIIFSFNDKFLRSLYNTNNHDILHVMIISNNRNIVSSSNPESDKYNAFIEIIDDMEFSSEDENLYNNVIRFESGTTQVFCVVMLRTGWKVVLCTDYSKDLTNMRKIRNFILLTSGLLIVFFLIINFNSLSLIVRPLRKLVDKFIPDDKIRQPNIEAYDFKNDILLAPYKLNFKHTLVLNFMVVIILPVIILIFLQISLFYNIIQNKIIASYSYYLEQTVIQIDSKLNRIENSLKNFYLDTDILKMMKNSEYREIGDYRELIKIPAQIIKEEQAINPDILYINVFDSDFSLIYSTSSSQQSFPRALIGSALSIKDGGTLYYGPYVDIFNRQVISIGKRIRTVLDLETAGFIHAVVNVTNLKESIATKISGADVCIYSEDGRTLVSSNRLIEYSSLLNETIINTGRGIYKNKEQNATIIFNKLKTNRWIIAIQIPGRVIKQMVWKTLLGNYNILTIYMLFLFLIIYVLVKRFYTPINILNQFAKEIAERIDKGINTKLKPENLSARKNEISQIEQILEYMEGEITKQANELYEKEMLKKATELYALQVEINPHFLFNTLETIRWKAVAQGKGENEVSEMIYQLSEFLKITLKNKDSFITVEEEIRYAKTFSNIMKFRYEDELDIIFNVDNNANKYSTIKMILQPLIENSIVHGFKEMTKKCIILVSIKLLEDKIVYQIKDNGIGIDETRLEEIKKCQFLKKKDGRVSIGLKNISERIRMNYGEGYGIEIESTIGIGTTVTIVIPTEFR